MRLSSNTSVEASTMGTADSTCGFDPDGAAHLMHLLSNLYSGTGSVVREYAANARDSHVAAGNPAPIEVTLPSMLTPNLVVRDYGLGMTRHDLLNLYGIYGKSTKSESDEPIGAYGVGSKSAFTMTSQFTVAAVHSGRRVVAMLALNAANVGEITVLSDEPTDERNGFTVTIPVSDPATVEDAARRVFETWQPGTVLVNGAEPETIFTTALPVGSAMWVKDCAHGEKKKGGLSLLMGPIAYPATSDMIDTALRDEPAIEYKALADALKKNMRLYAAVPMGSVDITPSREELRDSQRTIAMLRKVMADYLSQADQVRQQFIDAQPSMMHAAVALARHPHRWWLRDRTYSSRIVSRRGEEFTKSVDLKSQQIVSLDTSSTTLRSACSPVGDKFDLDFGQDLIRTFVVVTGVTDVVMQNRVRKVATRYMAAREGVGSLLLSPTAAGGVGWFTWGDGSPLTTVTVEQFLVDAKTSAALPSRGAVVYGATNLPGQVPVVQHREQKPTKMASDALAALPQRLIVIDESTGGAFYHPVVEANADAVLVHLTGAQTAEAALRRLPNAILLSALTKRAAEKVLAAYTCEDIDAVMQPVRGKSRSRHYYSHSHGYGTETSSPGCRNSLLAELLAPHANRINDPTITQAVSRYIALRDHQATLTEQQQKQIHVAAVRVGRGSSTESSIDLSGYPLLRSLQGDLSSHNPPSAQYVEHAVAYINTVRAGD